MMQKIKSITLTLAMLLVAGIPAIAVVPAYAADPIGDGLNCGVNLTPKTGTTCNASTGNLDLQSLLTAVINWFSLIVGVIAVIMIIVGGLKYITSGGDSNKVGSAKTTIIYALIGLVVVALAQLIVRFILNQTASFVGAGG